MTNEKNGNFFRRESEEAAELVTDGSCCPTPFFFSTIQEQDEEKLQMQFATKQEQNEEKTQKQFGTIQEQMKKNHEKIPKNKRTK